MQVVERAFRPFGLNNMAASRGADRSTPKDIEEVGITNAKRAKPPRLDLVTGNRDINAPVAFRIKIGILDIVNFTYLILILDPRLINPDAIVKSFARAIQGIPIVLPTLYSGRIFFFRKKKEKRTK